MIDATMSDSIVSALIGATATLAAVYVASSWLPKKRRREELIKNLQAQGAQVVEPIRNLLLDIEGLRVGDQDGADALLTRWRDKLRDPLVAWGMGKGSAVISQMSLDLRDAVGDVLRAAQDAVSNNAVDERPKRLPARFEGGLRDARKVVRSGPRSGPATRPGLTRHDASEAIPRNHQHFVSEVESRGAACSLCHAEGRGFEPIIRFKKAPLSRVVL
jgi:hypothetical protein